MESSPGVSFGPYNCLVQLLYDQQSDPFISELNDGNFFCHLSWQMWSRLSAVLEGLKGPVKLKYRLTLLCKSAHSTTN